MFRELGRKCHGMTGKSSVACEKQFFLTYASRYISVFKMKKKKQWEVCYNFKFVLSFFNSALLYQPSSLFFPNANTSEHPSNCGICGNWGKVNNANGEAAAAHKVKKHKMSSTGKGFMFSRLSLGRGEKLKLM